MTRRALLAAVVALGVAALPGTAHAAASPTTCGTVVTTSVTLENDLLCEDTDGLVVGADNVTIDLNGHRIVCTTPGSADGFDFTCLGAGANGTVLDDPEPEVGVDTNGHSDVLVWDSGVPQLGTAGGIAGFDDDVLIEGGSNVEVKALQTFGSGPNVQEPRPVSAGILVENTNCPASGQATIHVGAGLTNDTGNTPEGSSTGIHLRHADCVLVGKNDPIANASTVVPAAGIVIEDSADDVVEANDVEANGSLKPSDAGILLSGAGTTGAVLTGNTVTANAGDGISLRDGAAGNQVTNNVMSANGSVLAGTEFFDAADGPQRGNGVGLNFWDFNNECTTQTTPTPPPGVCP